MLVDSEIPRYLKGRSRSGYGRNGRTYRWLYPVVNDPAPTSPNRVITSIRYAGVSSWAAEHMVWASGELGPSLELPPGLMLGGMHHDDPNPYRLGLLPEALTARPAPSGMEACVLPQRGRHTS
jgi:hypothetical protein